MNQRLEEPGILPVSSLYAYAAIDCGCPYVNFTPSIGASVPALIELSVQRGAPIAGQDGKTGETLLKSVLAPMFASRNLRILSWVGHNILGNRDGQVLHDPRNKAGKMQAKDRIVSEILDYAPQTHTSIEYIESLNDWKTAWDHVHFRGFPGRQDDASVHLAGLRFGLAAPLVIDLARLALLAGRRKQSGILTHLACFFKSPMGVAEHDFSRQMNMLERIRSNAAYSLTRLMRLAFSSNAYLNYSFAEAARRIAAIGYRGIEVMADVPHAWPAYLLPEQKQALSNGGRTQRFDHFQCERVHDERDRRSAATVLASVVDRAGSALSPHSHRAHQASADSGARNRCAMHYDRAGRASRTGRILDRRTRISSSK